jgi:predicted dehydrogenase
MKILIIGLGSIGQRHVRNLRAILGEAVELLAYRVRGLPDVIAPTLHSAAGRGVELEYGIRVFPRLEDALAARPRIAFVCNPTSLHLPAALACVRAGCDLFLEKPVSHTLEGTAELVEAVESGRRIAMVGYQHRFHPCFLRMSEAFREGRLGRPLAVRASVGEYLPGWHPYEDYRQTYAARAHLGGGVVVSQIHEFDYLYALFGWPRRVFSLGGHLSRLEIDVEDVASALMEFRGDGHPFPAHLHQDYLQRPAQRCCEVIGEAGKASMDFSALSFTRHDEDGNLVETAQWPGFDRNQLFLDEVRHFLECVETRGKPVVDLRDGLCSLRMALAARESMTSGRVVELEDDPLDSGEATNAQV